MVQSIKRNGDHKQNRKRKAELVAPACRENCQVNHSIPQIAALLQVSTSHVEGMIRIGKLPVIECGVGFRKHLRIPHSALRNLETRYNS